MLTMYIELGALHILPHFISMSALKLGIIILILNARKSRLRMDSNLPKVTS